MKLTYLKKDISLRTPFMSDPHQIQNEFKLCLVKKMTTDDNGNSDFSFQSKFVFNQ